MLMTRILQTSKMATKYMNYESLIGSFIEALGQKLQSRIFFQAFTSKFQQRPMVQWHPMAFFLRFAMIFLREAAHPLQLRPWREFKLSYLWSGALAPWFRTKILRAKDVKMISRE